MQQVAEALGMDITTFSRQVKSLETKGLVSRSLSPDDRRVSLLGVSDAGRQILEKIDFYMTYRIEQIFSQMSAFERDTVARSIGLLNDAVSRVCEAGSRQEGSIACCK
jgi:DNA-binding MarR family transcriptional regulator